jgi:hypothetical protein
MSGEDGPREVIESSPAAVTKVALPCASGEPHLQSGLRA